MSTTPRVLLDVLKESQTSVLHLVKPVSTGSHFQLGLRHLKLVYARQFQCLQVSQFATWPKAGSLHVNEQATESPISLGSEKDSDCETVQYEAPLHSLWACL